MNQSNGSRISKNIVTGLVHSSGQKSSSGKTECVSVVIPTYNSSSFLEVTLESVFCQTRKPDEIIVADDASTDGTAELVEAVAKMAPVPLRLIRLERNSGGPARPLNLGIKASLGDLIATLDHDDVMLPQRLERQVECFQLRPTSGMTLVRCKISGDSSVASAQIEQWQQAILEELRCEELGSSCFLLDRTQVCDALVDTCFPLTCSNMMFARATWDGLDGFDESFRLSTDYDFVCRVAASFDICYCDEMLTSWTFRENSHFRSSQKSHQLREAIRIVRSIRRESLSATGRVGRRSRLRQHYLNAAQVRWQSKSYPLALAYYLASIGQGSFGMGRLRRLTRSVLRFMNGEQPKTTVESLTNSKG